MIHHKNKARKAPDWALAIGIGAPTSLPQELARTLRRLAQLAHTSSWDQWVVQGLTPNHRKILTLLSSRDEMLTLTELAIELGVTASTASESVSALVRRKLVRKQRSITDKRALALVLTESGQQCVKQLAELPDPLWSAFDALATIEQETLYRLSIKMIRGLEERGVIPKSRMCVRCKSFDPFRYAGSSATHYCHRANTPLSEGQLRTDCAVFEAGDDAAQIMLWQKFVTHDSK